MDRIHPIVGRASELAALTAVLEDATRGRAQAVIIEGVAGIGKSRLLLEALQEARARGLNVVHGSADELERDRPFRAVADALALHPGADDPRRADIGRLLKDEPKRAASPAGLEAVDLTFPIIDAVLALLEEECAAAPLVVAIEDLHWADPATLRLVRSVVRRMSSVPLALVVTMRPSPASAHLQLAVDDLLQRGGSHIGLQPLPHDASVQLARGALAAEVGPQLRRQIAGAGGSPLFVLELVSALRQEGAIHVDHGCAEVGEVSIPPSLRLTILRRLAFLPVDVLEIVKLAAILGSTFLVEHLAVVAGRSLVGIVPAVTQAIRAGVLGEEGDRLRFRHDLIREALYEEVPLPVRRGLHQQVGRALAAAGAAPIEVAEQLSLGAQPGDPEAVRWLRQAARQAASRSAPVAVRLLERALELMAPSDPERGNLLSDLAPPLLAVGRIKEAEAAVREALTLEADPAARVPLHRVLATLLFFRGDRPGARDLLVRNAEDPASPLSERAIDRSLAAFASLYLGDLEGARELAEGAEALATETEARFAAYWARVVLSVLARGRGEVSMAVDMAREAVELASREDSIWTGMYLHPALFHGLALLEADRLNDATEVLRAGRMISQQYGTWHTPWYQMWLGMCHLVAGAWDDAVAEATAGLGLVEEMEFTPFAAVLLPQGMLAAIALQRNDLVTARSAVAAADAELARTGPQAGIDAMLWGKALLAEADGRPQDALASLTNAWAIYQVFGYHLAHRSVGMDLVRLQVRAGDLAGAESVVVALETLASRAHVASAHGAALRSRGLVSGDADTLVAAVEAFRKSPRLFDRAQACEDAAVALARAGRSDAARELLNEAVDTYEELGAVRASARTEASLRALGVRRGRHGARRRPTTGWESLTKSERAVAELVAHGMTNRAIGERLFVSPRTVETHVAHLFRKLGASSRTELAREAIARLG